MVQRWTILSVTTGGYCADPTRRVTPYTLSVAHVTFQRVLILNLHTVPHIDRISVRFHPSTLSCCLKITFDIAAVSVSVLVMIFARNSGRTVLSLQTFSTIFVQNYRMEIYLRCILGRLFIWASRYAGGWVSSLASFRKRSTNFFPGSPRRQPRLQSLYRLVVQLAFLESHRVSTFQVRLDNYLPF